MSLVAFLLLATASATGCSVGMNANRQMFGSHIDPSIAVERGRAFDAQPWGFSYNRHMSLRMAIRMLFDHEMSGAYWSRAIAAAERIPEAKPVKEHVPADVLDRIDEDRRVSPPKQLAQLAE
jgi:hypothetical protein